jgi:general secretion pathway protein D
VTSFQYRNVGINISITPKVFVDGEIELQLQLETSTQLETRTIGGIELPVFGTRNVNNVVRLRDGETNLVGGLIQSEDRKVISGVPGLTDIPLLNKIFARNNDTVDANDVVFSITPHIIRAPRVTEIDLAPLPMGTEQQIRVPGNRPFIFDAARDAAVLEPEDVPPAPSPEPPGPEAPPPGPEAPAGPPAEPVPAPEPAPQQPPGRQPEPPASLVSVLFSPPTASLTAGQSVDVALIAGGAQGLSSGELTLSFDPALVRVRDARPGAFLTIDGRSVNFAPTFGPGQLRIVFSRPDDATGLVGSGHLLRMTVEAITAGPPSIVTATGVLRDPTGRNIPASFASLRIEVR